MKYVSIDLETCGLSYKAPERILMLSLIADDTEDQKPLEDLKHLTLFVDPRYDRQGDIAGEPYALQMNAWILRELLSDKPKYPVIASIDIHDKITEFLCQNFDLKTPKQKVTVAGKNVGAFDLQFLPAETTNFFHHRILDIGSLYFDHKLDTKSLPDLKECKKRAGIDTETAHDAYEDALDVIRCVRAKCK